MKRTIQQVSLIIGLIITTQVNAQISYTSNSFGTATDYVGWDNTNNFPLEIRHNGNQPIDFYTNGIQRMRIASGTGALGGYIGIGITTPSAPLHIKASGAANAQGWNRGILMENDAALIWSSDGIFGNKYLFMGHPTLNPQGDFYCGLSDGIGSSAPVNYVYKIYGSNSGNIIEGTTHFFKNMIIYQNGFTRNLGINVTQPQNTLEINSTVNNTSGLRFTNLTSINPPLLNPGNGVLSVDQNGDVIYVQSKSDLGNYCSNPQNSLTGNYEIPLDNNDFLFTDVFGTGRIIAGDVQCGTQPDARVYIRNNFSTSGRTMGLQVESNGIGSTGGYFNGEEYGIYAQSTITGYAGWFEGDVYVNGGTNSGTGYLIASDQQFKTSIDTIANATSIIQQLSPKTFFFDTVSTPQIKFGSERQYGFIAQEVELILPELVSEHTFPAQYDSLGNQTHAAVNYKGLNYNAFIAILMKGMQDQQAALDDKDSIISNLNDRLTTLENCLSGILPLLCQLSNASVQENDETTQKQLINELKVILEDNQNIVLEQNAPNPFAEQTVINYFIPEAVQQAEIVFYNLSGKMIQTVNITEKGNGKLTVYGNDLSSGTYTYSLIADGKLIATKKMVKK